MSAPSADGRRWGRKRLSDNAMSRWVDLEHNIIRGRSGWAGSYSVVRVVSSSDCVLIESLSVSICGVFPSISFSRRLYV